MILQIVKARHATTHAETHIILGNLDVAVQFAAWLEALGWVVEMTEGDPLAFPYTPEAYEICQVLITDYQRALAQSGGVC